MGNNIASQFVNSLRRSMSGTTVFSQSSSYEPEFIDPTELPGSARAWVSFYGIQFPNDKLCEVINKSTTVKAVSTTKGSNLRGDYTIEFNNGAFKNRDYLVFGSVESDTSDPISAANTFFIKGSGAGGKSQDTQFLRIQTINTALTSNNQAVQAAFARKINLVIYK